MKKVAPLLCLFCILVLTACSPETVREGGVVVRGAANGTDECLSYYTDEIIVYVTESGKKYHTADCSYLTGSAIPVSLDQAIAEGKTPCSRCCPSE